MRFFPHTAAVLLLSASFTPLANHAASPSSGEYILAKNGKSVCTIVLKENPSAKEKYAAEELSEFIAKMSGAKVKPEIRHQKSSAQYNIFLGTAKDSALAAKIASSKIKELLHDGYALKAGRDGIILIGGSEDGVIFGAYAFLRKLGMRWFHPGPDGEYCPKLPDLAVKECEEIVNPSFEFRALSAGNNFAQGENEFFKWQTRNGMYMLTHKFILWRPDIQLETSRRPAEMGWGGHAMSSMMESGTKKEELFKQHPEYYGIWNGKRNLHYWYCQPCTSNPEVIRRMADGIMKYYKHKPEGGSFLLGNDDHTRWCQCENCSRLDSEFDKKMGYVSTRYFKMIMDVYKCLKENNANGEFQAWAYQNFQYPPHESVVIDKNISITLCPHGRCFVHAIDDPACKDNARFYDIFKKWKVRRNRTFTLEYPGQLPSGCEAGESCQDKNCTGVIYLPDDRRMADTLKKYHELGIRGSRSFIAAYNTKFGGSLKENTYTRTQNIALWHYYYVTAYFLWDVNADYEKVFEDYGSKYYGSAWPAMRKYRLLLTGLFENGPHMRYGTPNEELAKCLYPAYSRERLEAYLNEAEKLAAEDPSALRKVRRERDFFNHSWILMLDCVLADAPDLKRTHRPETPRACAAPEDLVVDGLLKEKEWKKADCAVNFITDGKPAVPGAILRVLYDKNSIVLGLELLERFDKAGQCAERPSAEEQVAIRLPRPGASDLVLEFRPDGKFIAGQSGATGVMRTLIDRRSAEVRIPVSTFGFHAAEGNKFSIGVERIRVEKGKKTEARLAGPNKNLYADITLGAAETIRNGSFEVLIKRKDLKDYIGNGVFPQWLTINPIKGAIELVRENAAHGYNALCFKGAGAVFFNTRSPENRRNYKIKVSCRAKGHGKMSFSFNRYKQVDGHNRFAGHVPNFFTAELNSGDWQYYETVYEHNFEERNPSLRIDMKGQECFLDDVRAEIIY
ncbi:MAG: hypothetical protein BWY31_02765 [Lentisphaerae bacterium ADurb.Bin242]|nr:MAG: hypothetical protein BWY31_02765 [Lentisphaerae bacterium ADurb.Bin242]